MIQIPLTARCLTLRSQQQMRHLSATERVATLIAANVDQHGTHTKSPMSKLLLSETY